MMPRKPDDNELMIANFKLGVPMECDDVVRQELLRLGLDGPHPIRGLGVVGYYENVWNPDLEVLIAELKKRSLLTRTILSELLKPRLDQPDPYAYQSFDFVGQRKRLEQIGFSISDEVDECEQNYSTVQVFRPRHDSVDTILVRHRVRGVSLNDMFNGAERRLGKIHSAHTGLPGSSGSGGELH